MSSYTPDQFGFAFIKTGYEPVLEELVDDFSNFGIKSIHHRKLILGAKVVDYIYRDSHSDFFYADMFQHLTAMPVTTLTLYGELENTQRTLYELKHGLNGLPNLRAKYTASQPLLPDEEVRAWQAGMHPKQAETTIRLTQKNVFHTADDTNEALATIALLNRNTIDYFNGYKHSAPIKYLIDLVEQGKDVY